MKTIEEMKEARSPLRTMLVGMVRRVVVRAVKASRLAQLEGLVGAYGETEADEGVWFPGLGIRAIPPAGANLEGIGLQVGGSSNHTVLVSVHDSSTKVPGGDPVADETVLFNSVAFIKIDKDGNITLRAKAGGTVSIDDGAGAVALALKSDVTAIATELKKQFDIANGHKHAAVGGPPTGVGTGIGTGYLIPTAVGTTVVKGK